MRSRWSSYRGWSQILVGAVAGGAKSCTAIAAGASLATITVVSAQAEPRHIPPDKEEIEVADRPARPASAAQESICLMVESAARENGLPTEFFARVIWQESRFRANAVGPVTRSGERAQGIAQFMPGTAAERQLLDPFDPVQALPKSAEFLAQLRRQFGNLGLAAAAYNAGPRRVREWLDGTGYMPSETRAYVAAITGLSVDDWAKGRNASPRELPGPNNCGQMIALLKRAPNVFVTELEQRVVRAATQPWGVQLAASFSRNIALASYGRAMSRLKGVLAESDPSILTSRMRSRGTRTFYQVRVGKPTRLAADELCSSIRRAGGACMVLRNGRA